MKCTQITTIKNTIILWSVVAEQSKGTWPKLPVVISPECGFEAIPIAVTVSLKSYFNYNS